MNVSVHYLRRAVILSTCMRSAHEGGLVIDSLWLCMAGVSCINGAKLNLRDIFLVTHTQTYTCVRTCDIDKNVPMLLI